MEPKFGAILIAVPCPTALKLALNQGTSSVCRFKNSKSAIRAAHEGGRLKAGIESDFWYIVGEFTALPLFGIKGSAIPLEPGFFLTPLLK